MQKINSFPASQSLNEYAESVCPVDAHIRIATHGTWADNADGFTNQAMSGVTTTCNVVRSWAVDGKPFFTLEKWEHDNGYRCELVILSKSEFLSLINSK